MTKKISVLLALCTSLICITPCYATGTPNLDTNGDDLTPSGSSQNYWSSGNEGVRITVVHEASQSPVSTPIDFTNKTFSGSMVHFGAVSKLNYRSGTPLVATTSGYQSIKPSISIPSIIQSNGSINITALRAYFSSEYMAQLIANLTGMTYETLISGEYVLLIEPIAYFMFQGRLTATTATEVALYDPMTDGWFYYWLRTVSHRNLPLSLFLEPPQLGFSAASGTVKLYSNSEIFANLGLACVRYTDKPIPQTVDIVYRTDTEVITSVTISGGQSDPDNPTSVTFTIDGTQYRVGNVYYPEGGSQLAWVKWRTPTEEKTINISVSTTGTGYPSQSYLTCEIEDLNENPPPNPVADDRNDDFTQESVPDHPTSTSKSWSVWTPWWQEFWVDNGSWHSSSWTDSEGNSYSSSYWVSNWEDEGWWEFDYNGFSANLSVNTTISPDSTSPTASSNGMKSGYGFNQQVTTSVSTNGSSAVTSTPNAVTYFPEFGYETYWRLLDRIRTGLSATLQFQQNVYSTYQNRTHFTPIWYPNGQYTVSTWLLDVWTPSGMMSTSLTGSLTISGNLWDDWHIGPQ